MSNCGVEHNCLPCEGQQPTSHRPDPRDAVIAEQREALKFLLEMTESDPRDFGDKPPGAYAACMEDAQEQARRVLAKVTPLSVLAEQPADMVLKWEPAPTSTKWGAGMVEALLPIGKDHTLRLYAEEEVAHLVPCVLIAAAGGQP
jgi:hypothetical protein